MIIFLIADYRRNLMVRKVLVIDSTDNQHFSRKLWKTNIKIICINQTNEVRYTYINDIFLLIVIHLLKYLFTKTISSKLKLMQKLYIFINTDTFIKLLVYKNYII